MGLHSQALDYLSFALDNGTYLARVVNGKDDHDAPHKRGVEYIWECLVLRDITIGSRQILHEPKDASDHNQRASYENSMQMFLPGNLHGWARGIPLKPQVETEGRDDEDTESDDLSNEADNDDGFRSV